MKLEKDINRIKRLSLEKEEENWGFRSFLKSCEFPHGKIDAMVQRLDKKISAKIDCKECGNCCREILPVLKDTDIANMAAGLKLSVDQIKAKYLEKEQESEGYTFNSNPCPFLEGNICTVHNFRPDDCRSYPHLYKKNFTSRTISVIKSCSICPIAFNVYEQLKSEVWEMDEFDEFYGDE
ncbi:MAG: YkgJ family cysteine cluster protein [bacterium]|nr:YkgJ family cysteine cluster protein [bacterium]